MNYQAQLNLGDVDSPIPMIRTKETLDLLSANDVLKVTVARDSAVKNIKTLIANNTFELLQEGKEADQFVLWIKKV